MHKVVGRAEQGQLPLVIEHRQQRPHAARQLARGIGSSNEGLNQRGRCHHHLAAGSSGRPPTGPVTQLLHSCFAGSGARLVGGSHRLNESGPDASQRQPLGIGLPADLQLLDRRQRLANQSFKFRHCPGEDRIACLQQQLAIGGGQQLGRSRQQHQL